MRSPRAPSSRANKSRTYKRKSSVHAPVSANAARFPANSTLTFRRFSPRQSIVDCIISPHQQRGTQPDPPSYSEFSLEGLRISLSLSFFSLSLSLCLSLSVSLCLCGQTLNNDGLLSVWFNDEDCPAYVRDAYFLNW